jgi:hypothetical protein
MFFRSRLRTNLWGYPVQPITMPHPAPRARLRGHGDTPILVGLGSLVFGLLWAATYCHKHSEFTLWHKVGMFVLSPLVGFAELALLLTIVVILGSGGDWVGNRIFTVETSPCQR